MAKAAGQLPQHAQTAAAGLNQMAGSVAALGEAGANLQKAAQEAYTQNRGVYDLMIRHTADVQTTGRGEAFYGGSAITLGGYFGGDETEDPSKALKEYRHSLAAATKDRIVRGLARALKRAGVDVDEDASAEEIARTLKSKLPDPKKGKTFAADAKAQEKVCKTIADVLNDEFTPGSRKEDKLIDTSLGAVSICRQVAELVHSLSAGLHTEFLEVHASLTRILRDLEVLDEILSELHSNILAQFEGAGLKTGADKKIADFQEVYRRAQRERERQMSMLRNFLSVTLAPAQEELAIAMRDEGEAHDMINRLKLVPGTGEFADTLAMAVSGLGTVAAVTARVDKALKDVGMSVEQYLHSGDMSSLEDSLDRKLMSGDVKSDDIGKFLKAVHTLKENFYRRSELDFESAKTGGDDEKSSLDRRVEKRKMERKLIVKEFIDKSSRQYDALLKAVQELGPHLGKQVPLGDKLEALRNALAQLSQSRLGALNLELALIGYYSDASGREKKETFLAGLRVVQSIIDDIMSLEMYRGSSQYFSAMRAAIDGLIRTVDFYSDVISKKYGSGDDEEEVTGGQPEELSGLPEIARSSYDLDRAINTFLYFFYVAKVRSNLRQTNKELEYYGEKYNDVLGDAVAARLRQLTVERDAKLAEGVYNPAGAGAATAEKAKKIIRDEYECKANFYRALQALDLYMKAFTDGIVANPDDVADVKRMLDGVQVIGRWFVEDTGDALAAAFDMMPSYDGANFRDPDITSQNGAHYYEKLAASPENNNVFTPGVPQLPVEADDADAVKRQVGKVFDNFQALKNITNAFARIGDKFGGRELRQQVFMSPTQIYKALIDYLKCSAMSIDTRAAQAGGTQALGVNISRGLNEAPAEVYFGSIGVADLDGNFTVEDKYFTFCVKAMAAKVLTVIGVYDLFERPSPVYELTPTRMIIGGSDYDAVPEVIPEASELYFRLPRLVEFYKNLFTFDTGGADVQISMLPEMEGVFSGIIRLIFQRVEGGAAITGDYSDLEVRSLVREINSIYENFRGSAKGSIVSEALSAFVMEINRRYGLVKKDEWQKLQNLLRESRRAGEFGELNRTNYAILPGEEEYQADRRAPSDRYLGPGAAAQAQLPGGKFKIDDTDGFAQWVMLKEFRAKLDGFFNGITPDEFTTYSFSTIIRQGEIEMRRAEGAADKIGVAARLIQGSGSLAGIDVSKAFMFHETVVVGLNLLNAIYTILADCRQRLVDTDVEKLQQAVREWAETLPAGAINNAAIVAALNAANFSAQARGYVRADAYDFREDNGAAAALTAADLYNRIEDAITAGAVTAPQAQTLASHAFDSNALMRDILLVITGLTVNFQGLVTARYPRTATGQIHLDFSGLRSAVGALMDDVRYFMDMFRPHIAKSVIAKFEDKSNRGSFYWLEENLLDGLVRGLPDDMAQAEDDRAKTLEWMSRKVNQSYSILVGYSRYSLAQCAPGAAAGVVGPLVVTDGGDRPPAPNAAGPIPAGLGGGAAGRATGASYYNQYGRLMSQLAFYNAADPGNNSGVAAGGAAYGTGIAQLISTIRPQGVPVPLAVRPRTSANAAVDERIQLWNIQEGLLADRSIMFSFNQLVAKFIKVFYDAASGKIYRPLIDGFANGAFSRAVMTPGSTMPDLANAAGAVFGVRGDPTAQGVLAQSIGLILQRLASDISPSTQVSDHLVATLSEIPLYIRESYRANLPAFIKLFEMVQQEAEFYKQLMSQTQIQCGRLQGPQATALAFKGAGLAPADKVVIANGQVVTDAASNTYPAESTKGSIHPLVGTPTDSDGTKARITAVLDSVAAGCYSMSNAAVQVLREIADEPLYLQTHDNSIQEYQSRYGKMPLMPISSSLTYLRGVDNRLMPEHSTGDASFKLMYGTRGLLGRPTSKFTLADAPGVRANLESYNGGASGREKIDAGRYDAFLGNFSRALRFVVDVRSYRGALAPVGLVGDFLRMPLVAPVAAGNISIIEGDNAAYAVRSEPTEVLAVTESSYQDQELKKISDVVGGAGPVSVGQDRTKEWIYNIIDMNIIPINVHALMRGIPLAPLYNYVYTFEQMVCLMFGQTVDNIGSMGIGNIVNTRQAFLKLMLDPYMDVTPLYGAADQTHEFASNRLIPRMFRGDDSLMMGRPKFLSDQVFNKALFGTLVPSPYVFDEAGPAASGRLEAGRLHPRAAANPGGVVAGPAGLIPTGAQATWNAAGNVYQAQAVPANAQAAQADAQRRYGVLTYIGVPGENAVPEDALKVVQMGANAHAKIDLLNDIGKLRFDTRLVRNLFFITNVQRLMRLKMNQELTQYRNVLVGDHSVINPGVTEYGSVPPSGLSSRRLAEYGSANETESFRGYDSDRRLVQ